MKLVKSGRRTLISEKTLSNSLMIKLEGPTIQEFNPDTAIDLWFNKCQRRPGSQENKQDVDEATAGLSIVDETDKEIEQDEEIVEHMKKLQS